ncbi:Phosphoglycerate dehydrogenase [Caloramator quimbayensis]|uniref:Phosphoglycerate dehydrogenase n=1 Tax=Caloramator quimbayensis TaxID=1147123 RepID=A0A1T4XZK8_9CLOT|nr:phosphoglycerate dehydrogenase [Caloramator quimbayensis]SKA94979.1 Phosphoglycerate dehydrogenase [Caloramator quimbayensis]
MKVLFTYDYGTEKMQRVSDLGYNLIYKYEGTISNSPDIEDAQILVCYNPFSKIDISKFYDLKWIQLSSIGIDQVPKDIVLKRGITVTNNKSGYSIPIGEWIVLKTLELFKKSKEFYKKQDNKIYKLDTSLLELYNKTILFIGTGSIAVEAAKRFSGFGVNILGINTTGKNAEYFNECYPLEKLNNVLNRADVVVLSIPSTDKTYHLINKERLKLFKSSSFLINISRGSIIKECDLIDALKEGIIAGAALDVFENEPLPPDSHLWELENVIITPHNSWISEMRNERRFNIIYDNLKRYINGEPLKNVVDIIKGY